jgi:SAM-dependent methyltransferase
MSLSMQERREAAKRRSLALYQAAYSQIYRQSDVQIVESQWCKDVSEKLQSISKSFGRPISVVDFACGTGRFFHTMAAAERLTGIDLSEHMLSEARSPVRPSAAKELSLVKGGMEKFDELLPETIDFVYAIGVFGNHCPFDEEVCNSVYRVLRFGGIFFLTVSDPLPRIQPPRTLKRSVMEWLYPLLPKILRKALDRRWLNMGLTERELLQVIHSSAFHGGLIEEEAAPPEGHTGRHYFCTLTKRQ